MKKMNKKDMMILAGATIISMAAGIVVGCMKEKMKNDTYCIIDEMQDLNGSFSLGDYMRIERLKEIVLGLIAFILIVFLILKF